MIRYSKKSTENLFGVHPILSFFALKVMNEMQKRQLLNIDHTDFGVFNGVRTYEEQVNLVKKGYSKTYNSYHLYGLAIDLVVYKNGYTWNDKKYKKDYDILLQVCNDVIRKEELPIDNGFALWGFDKPHFQMTGLRSQYDIRKILGIK